MDRTRQAVEAQLRAMGTAHFELGVFSRAPSAEALLLRLQAGGAGRPLANAQAKRLAREAIRQAAHRPQAPAALEEAAQRIQQASARMRLRVRTAPEIGAGPAVVTETSPGNYQAWIRLAPGPIPEELATAVAKDLARQYGGDPASAHWRHMGRLAGFTNQKPNRTIADGPYRGRQPFVLLREAGGRIAPTGPGRGT